MKLEIYCDGGCRGNPGIGAWATCAFLKDGSKHIRSFGSTATTNNIMELTGAIESAKIFLKNYANDYSGLIIKTDSKYTIDCVKTWITNWKKNNWRTAAKKPVKNAELIKELDTLVNGNDFEMEWVKGHTGIEGNEICDQYLNQTMDHIQTNNSLPPILDIHQ